MMTGMDGLYNNEYAFQEFGFETEYDNECENKIKDLSFVDNDTDSFSTRSTGTGSGESASADALLLTELEQPKRIDPTDLRSFTFAQFEDWEFFQGSLDKGRKLKIKYEHLPGVRESEHVFVLFGDQILNSACVNVVYMYYCYFETSSNNYKFDWAGKLLGQGSPNGDIIEFRVDN